MTDFDRDDRDQPPSDDQSKPQKKKVGFALLDKKRLAEVSALGGASVPHTSRSFAQDRNLARKAGAKGGKASHGGGRRRVVKTALRRGIVNKPEGQQ